MAAGLIRKHGANRAARELGINRITVLGLAAGARAAPATFALIREHLARREASVSELGR